jgi:hypothetical protein
MRRACPAAALALGVACLQGCASVTRGAYELVVIESAPPGAVVTASDGSRCTTPCSLRLSRKKDYDLIFEKAGYERARARVSAKVAGAGAAGMAGNVIAGGLIGMGVDAATGAAKTLTPNPVSVDLVPLAAPPARGADVPPAEESPPAPP